MELVILSGPGVQMTPTAHDMRTWAIVGVICAAIMLADAALACVSLVYAWRARLVTGTFPPEPRDAGVTGSYCALCNTLNGYATIGELLAGATLLTLLGGVVYLLGKVD